MSRGTSSRSNLAETCHAINAFYRCYVKVKASTIVTITACQLLLIHGLFQQTAGSWFPLMALQPHNIAIFYIHLSRHLFPVVIWVQHRVFTVGQWAARTLWCKGSETPIAQACAKYLTFVDWHRIQWLHWATGPLGHAVYQKTFFLKLQETDLGVMFRRDSIHSISSRPSDKKVKSAY
jgi:hypothetical protein